MFITRMAIPRRTFLRGMGATIALPLLDAMAPALSAAPKATPRFSFLYISNGVIQDQWTPATTGTGYELTPILRPLAAHKSDINVISGLAHLQADTFGDGTGDHPRASAAWLTGVHAYDRTLPGVEVKLATSADQIIAEDVGSSIARAVGGLSDAGVVRLGRLLLREHALLAQRDDAQSDRDASARRLRAA